MNQQRETPVPSMIIMEAKVTEIDILILESFPVQVNVIARGEFPDSCTEISKVTITREGDTFFISISTSRPYDKCVDGIISFKEVIPLDVVGLPAGIYTVDVNGVIGTFELQIDNISQ
jgi:inhibitor of cysteine peptidase